MILLHYNLIFICHWFNTIVFMIQFLLLSLLMVSYLCVSYIFLVSLNKYFFIWLCNIVLRVLFYMMVYNFVDFYNYYCYLKNNYFTLKVYNYILSDACFCSTKSLIMHTFILWTCIRWCSLLLAHEIIIFVIIILS